MKKKKDAEFKYELDEMLDQLVIVRFLKIQSF